MQGLFSAIATVVSRRPRLILLIVLAVTVVLGALNAQMVTQNDIVLDDDVAIAQRELDARFGNDRQVVQVLITGEDSLVSSTGVEAQLAVLFALQTEVIEQTFVEDPDQSALIGPFDPLLFARPEGDVATAYQASLEQLPDELAGLYRSLLSENETRGLVLVVQDTTGLTDEQALANQQLIADAIDALALPQGITATAFSIQLMLTASDVGPEVGRLFGTALLIILLVLAVVYWGKAKRHERRVVARRTAADVGLTLLVIVLAVVWMQGLGVLAGPDYLGLIEYFSPQTQVVPILIIGLGVDFGIHLLARYRTALAQGNDPHTAFVSSSKTVGITLALCTAATAIGFLTNLASPVGFLAALGVLAALGIISAFILTMTLLPAVRVLLDRRGLRRGTLPLAALGQSREAALPRVIGKSAWLAERHPAVTLAAATLLVGVGVFGYTQLDSEFSVTDFVPKNEPLLATFAEISTAFAGGFDESTSVLITGDLARPDAHNQVIDALSQVAELDDVVTFGTSADASSLAGLMRSLDEPTRDTFGVLANGKVAADTDVALLYQTVLDTVPSARDVLAVDGDTFVSRAVFATRAGEAGAGQLANDINALFVDAQASGVAARAVSPAIQQASLGTAIEASQLRSLAIALGAAMMLLVAHFALASGIPFLGVITVLPVGLVLALTFATMALTGIPLNPVTATLAALSIGIGVPFTIHVTSRFLEERQRDASGSAIRRTLTDTGGALVGSALTTAIGFGVLVTSTLKPFEQLGYVIVYAIVYSVIAAILVLPSLLTLWDARHKQNPLAG